MWLSLCAFFYPVVMKAYDGIFVALVINCCRKRFSLTVACATLVALLATVPMLVLKLCSDTDASAEELTASATFAKSGAKLRAAFNDLKACCFCLSERRERMGSWRTSRRKVRPDDEANLMIAGASRRTGGRASKASGGRRNLKESADDDGDGGEGGEGGGGGQGGGGGGMADDDFADFGGDD